MAVTPEQAAATLRQRSTEAKRAAERRAAAARESVLATVRPLLGTRGHAWLIGSLAWGGFGERSDVDLVLDELDDLAATAIEIATVRAVGAEVDVLRLDDLSPSFRERVEREGLPIHDR